jgi:FtsH-binding integral membrane protein
VLRETLKQECFEMPKPSVNLMETVREKDESTFREEDPTLRKTVYTFLGLAVVVVYIACLYFLLAFELGNLVLSVLGVIGIIASLVLLYRLSQKFIRFNPR